MNDSGRTDGQTAQFLQELTALRKRVAQLEGTQAGFEQQGGNNMKKLLFGTMLLALVFVVPLMGLVLIMLCSIPVFFYTCEKVTYFGSGSQKWNNNDLLK